MKQLLLGLVLCAGWAGQLTAAYYQTFSVDQAVPDNDPSGLVSVGTVSGSVISAIEDLNIVLQMSDGYNGDLYVTLSHGDGFAVLLNRVGRRTGDSYGYTDAGFGSTFKFDDQAANGDVHVYRFTLFSNHTTPVGGPLGGTWAPDARMTDPSLVLDTDTRSSEAMLSSFNSFSADGTWTLFLADLGPMGESHLVSWGLEINSVVPELTSTTMVAAGILLFIAIYRRWRVKTGVAPRGYQRGEGARD